MEDFVCGFGPACGYLKRHQCAFKHPGAPFQNLTIEELIPRLLELERKQAQTFLSVLNLKRRPQHRHNRHQQAFRRPFDRRPIVVSSSPPLLPLPASVPVRSFSPAPVLPRSSAWPPVSFASVVASAEVFTPASFPVLPPRRGDDVLSPLFHPHLPLFLLHKRQLFHLLLMWHLFCTLCHPLLRLLLLLSL